MRSVLEQQLAAVLGPGMTVPEPLARLYQWIEARELYVDRPDGRIGFLFPEGELRAGWSETERPGGTLVEFAAVGSANMKYWLGSEDESILSRVCVFAQTGGEGSTAALWRDDAGAQRIVHLGSGSGSVLACVLADDPIDFLRLLAIGYDEICWDDQFSLPPNESLTAGHVYVHPNVPFQEWVCRTFSTTVPRTALDVVKHRAHIGDPNSPDPFCRWAHLHSR